MRFLIKLGILLNLVGFFGLFYWDGELKKESVKIESIKKQLPTEEQALEFFLKKYERKWSYKDKQTFLNTVRVASKHYNIETFDLMTFVALESNYKIDPRPKTNRNGTFDYGLTQQNSNYYKGRYKIVSRVAKQYGLDYNIENKFDITLNVLSCAYFVNSLKKEIRQKYDTTTHFQVVASYNTGIKGFYKNRKIAKQYYQTFMKLRSAVYNA